ncbi:MAG TPA: LysM peptidoglycan-binding domain-containing protein [Candidatus Tenderia electrophaga]|uniref:LysM peptidoglycan-binding domain-containing protein n=1 Tax=Candidatus Tenderia electrophaga TaxID=1748243 RepID=A0A832J7Y6_9GAMM|nr:LysM peptidoglycan-binding domain-containing protein [Candidatus Tenderia electrophaga]
MKTMRVNPKAIIRSTLLAALFSLTAAQSWAEEWVYTVRPGDTLSGISHDYLISTDYWPKVKQLNGIGNVRHLAPGTRLRIPLEWLKQHSAIVKVIASRGDVSLIDANASMALTSNTQLQAGQGIRTGRNSSITIEFADGSRILILPNSEIKIESTTRNNDTGVTTLSVQVLKGQIENRVAPQQPGGRYRITTPAAVAAVRGTTFRVSADDGGDVMRSEVLQGKVNVTGSSVSRNVGAGFATLAKTGQPPSIPTQIPAAPDLSGLIKRTAVTDVNFSWPAMTNVVSYRAQLAQDASFNTPVYNRLIESPQVTWQALTPGNYFMRARGIDEMGFEGFNASHAFVIIGPPKTPKAYSPKDEATLPNPRPFIAWSQIQESNFYHLQIATDQAFSQIFLDIPNIVNTNYKPIEDLTDGQYFWRVQSVSSDGSHSRFSAARTFTIHGNAQ